VQEARQYYPRKLPREASRFEPFTRGQIIIADLNRAKLGDLIARLPARSRSSGVAIRISEVSPTPQS
jgi:hypothetical protein